MMIWGYLFSFLYAVLVLLIGAVAYKFGVKQCYSRKIIHILVGFEWFILSYFHGASVHFLLVCLAFLAFLYLVYRKRWMQMMSSDKQNAPGTVYYALSMSILATVSLFFSQFIYAFGIGVLATSLGDGFGGIVGQAFKRNPKLYKNKTLFGTLAVFIFTFIPTLIFVEFSPFPLTLGEILAIALLAMGVELLSTKGLDNIFVPILTSFFSFLLYYSRTIASMKFALALIPLLLALTLGKKKLTLRGALSAAVLDVVVAFAFGDAGFAVLISFFALALLCDEVPRLVERGGKRGECRTEWQVLSNSALALLSSLSYLVFSHKNFLFIFIITLAEALGDTAASGFGVLAKKTYDPFHLRPIEKGESGGMSFIGTLSGTLLSFALCAFGGLLFSIDKTTVLVLFFCALFGVLLDSALGSLVQMKYACDVCKKTVETPMHCDKPTRRIRGIFPFDNNFVNLLSSLGSIVLFLLIYFL